jgi:DNA polymerase III alpha subunit
LLDECNLEGGLSTESSGMLSTGKRIKVSTGWHFVSISAFNVRDHLDAGPFPNSSIENMVVKRIEYEHELRNLFSMKLYGIMVYQEQIMRIAPRFSGYSLEVDSLVAGTGKRRKWNGKNIKPFSRKVPKKGMYAFEKKLFAASIV